MPKFTPINIGVLGPVLSYPGHAGSNLTEDRSWDYSFGRRMNLIGDARRVYLAALKTMIESRIKTWSFDASDAFLARDNAVPVSITRAFWTD